MKPKVDDSFEIMEGGSGDKTLYSIQVMEQYRACVKEGSKEKTTGGVINRIVNGEAIEIAVPNQLEIFINSVDSLFIMLTPYILEHQDTIAKDVIASDNRIIKIKNKAKELKENITKKFKGLSTKKNPSGISDRDKYREKYDSTIQQIKEREELALYKAHRYLLVTISLLLNTVNYFEEGSG